MFVPFSDDDGIALGRCASREMASGGNGVGVKMVRAWGRNTFVASREQPRGSRLVGGRVVRARGRTTFCASAR